MRRLLGVGLAAAALAAPAAADAASFKSLPGRDGADVSVRRTSHGIPHILGRSFRDVGYGYGYAFAQDNICQIASSYVTVRAERSRFFGPNESWKFEGNSTTANNLNSDFFFKRIIDTRVVEGLLGRRPPNGPRPEVKDGVRGYVAGYNRYLRETGVDRLPDPTCRGKPWVRPIREIDVYRYFYKLALLASSGVAIDGIGGAQPPTPALGSGGPLPLGKQLDLIKGNLDRFSFGGLGSNAYGLGADATASGRGMVLGNPHFPWQGSQRFYQSHLTIPGKADVAGASLFGVPIVLIGHTKNFAWSHTVSTARRFTPFELKLVPGSPTSYLYDGQVRQMKADRVTVGVPGGTRTRTLYSTVHGPVVTSIVGLPLFPWTSAQAHALGDINAANFRYLNHFLETNLTQSVRQYDRVQRRNQGIPWVNSIAADSRGEAYYADIGAIPNVPNEKARQCNTALGSQTTNLLGLPILDGSRTACRWSGDADAIQPGAFGPSHLPSLFRRDYVTNSNDSYWLSNPARRLEGFARIIGDERTARSLRTRLGLRMVQEQLGGGRRFTLDSLRHTVFNNRQHAGELFRDALVGLCRSSAAYAPEACSVLAAWNVRDDLDSRGAVLFRRFAANALAGPGGAPVGTPPGVFRNGFDVRDPVNTPNGLNTDSPTVRQALSQAIQELRSSGIPLDARLREYQTEARGGERIPIHGGPGALGVFNAISAPFVPGQGFPDVVHGSSFVMAAETGGRCPDSRSILTYSQSTNPRSRFYADQTRLYSRKRWVDMRFCVEELLSDRVLDVTELGCVSGTGLRSARVSGRRRVRLGFRRRVRLRTRVEVYRVTRGGRLRRVLVARRGRSFTLRRRLRSGLYVARFTALSAPGRRDVRDVVFRKGRRGVRTLRPTFSRPASCGTLRSATLGSPLFGRGGARLRLRLGRQARVGVTVLRGRRRVARTRTRTLRAGSRRLRLPRVGRGAYRFRVVVRAGGRRSAATLGARRR